jgi:hypothetical protein
MTREGPQVYQEAPSRREDRDETVQFRDGRKTCRIHFNSNGELVNADGRVQIPADWELRFRMGRQVAAVLEFEMIDMAPVCTEVHLYGKIGPAAASELNRKIRQYTDQCVSELLTHEWPAKPIGPGVFLKGGPDLAPEDEAREIKAAKQALLHRQSWPMPLLQEIAAVYYNAGQGKHAAVMKHFGVSKDRANLFIRKTRAAGLIGKSGQGRADSL